MKILAAALGDCIHVIGARNFLHLAENAGFETQFLGPAVAIEELVRAVQDVDPEIVGVSYRLSGDACEGLLDDLKARLAKRGLLDDRVYLFGGTPETGRAARDAGFFSDIFDGHRSRDDVIRAIRRLARGAPIEAAEVDVPPDRLIPRIERSAPMPLLRHHIGLSSVDETVAAVRELAEAEVLDVLSIAPDQTAQQAFFRPDDQAGMTEGSGGVPVRTPDDLRRIRDAANRGNRPLCRCYSGTADVFRWASMLLETIGNAWCAVPLSWYSELDRRGVRPLSQSIPEAQELMRWHAKRGVPVEVNEPHQWSLRRASDAVGVATAYLGALNAKRAGVRDYIAQYMLNTPGGLSSEMDLGKIQAMISMIESLHDESFMSYREVRPGLSSFPSDVDTGRARLVFSTLIGMALSPHIVHVVAYCEGHHVAGAKEIIESARMTRWTLQEFLAGTPGAMLLEAPNVRQRARELVDEAQAILDAIRALGRDEEEDPLTSPRVLEQAIRWGILDAPDLEAVGVTPGKARTAIVGGACVSIDPHSGVRISERERVARILEEAGVA